MRTFCVDNFIALPSITATYLPCHNSLASLYSSHVNFSWIQPNNRYNHNFVLNIQCIIYLKRAVQKKKTEILNRNKKSCTNPELVIYDRNKMRVFFCVPNEACRIENSIWPWICILFKKLNFRIGNVNGRLLCKIHQKLGQLESRKRKNKRKTMNFPTINHPKNFGWNIKTNLIKLVLIAILRCYSQGYSRTSSNSLLAQTIVRVPNRMVEKKGLEKRTMHGIAYFMQIDSIR